MSFERTKIQQLAQKFLAKGQVDKAITEFQRIVKHDPTDTRTWLKIGDLYTRGGQNREAIQAYEKVADYYSQQGIYRKAVAVYSQILKLDNTRINVQRRLADAYDKLGLSSDAVTTYEKCAQAYMKAAQVDPALEVYEAILKLDPVHIAAHVACGELLSAKGQKEQACPHFEKAAWELKKLGRFDEFVKVSERLLYHNEDYQDISRALARVYLSRNQAQLALAKLQPCYQRNSKDCETLELLAQTFAVLEQVSMSASIYQEAARLYAEQKNYEGEARMWRALRELDADNAAATARLNELRSQRLIKDEPAVPDILPEVPDDYLTEDISEEISVETNGLIDDNEGDSQGGVIFFDEEPDKTAAEVSQVEVAEAVAAANGTADPMDGRRETVQLDTDSDDASGAAQDPLTLGAERSSSSIIGDLELVLEHVQELIAGGQVRAAQQILLQAKRDFPTNMLVKEAEIEIASLIRSRKRSGSFPKVNIVYREGPSLADKIAKELRSSRPPQALGSVALDAKKEFAGSGHCRQRHTF